MNLTRADGKVYENVECMGCDIANHKLQPFGGMIYEDENFTVCADFEVPIDGFIIISTKAHISSINDMTEGQKVDFIMLLDKCLKALKELGTAEEFILIQGERKDIHFHISLMPRQKWMSEKFGRIISNIKNIQSYAIENMKTTENLNQIEETCKKLREKLK